MAQTPRETAGVTTRLILAYVRRQAGEPAVARVLASAGLPHTREQLEDERFWSSYGDKIALFEAAEEILRDPHVGRHVGESLFDAQIGSALRLLIGTLGSPRQVLRSVSKAAAKFTTSATMTTVSTTRRSGTVSYRVHPPNRPHRADCGYTAGILSQMPVLFGLPPAEVHHPRCQVTGDEACVYEVRWSPRRVRDRFRRRPDASAPFEAEALREQLVDLQRTVADLVSTPDLDELLHRIADRAGASVRGTRHLLVVQLDGEAEPRIHAEGFTCDGAEALGAALRSDASAAAAEHRIVAEVASTQRRYGWLAAELPEGQPFLPADQQQLEAYSRLAAAALDAATALEEARRRGEVAEALLRLGHDLSQGWGEAGIAQRICEAAPTVVGATRASVMYWDPMDRLLRAAAVHGYEGDEREHALAFAVPWGATDELEAMEGQPSPVWLSADHPEAYIRDQLAQWSASVMAAAPFVVHGGLAGVLLVSWPEDEPPRVAQPVVLHQLSALADQTSTALSAARSLEEARHQATHDPLTGLSNRVLFTERFERALADGRRTGRHPAVCFVDLDGFKAVNDAHGHAVGDELLVQVGTRILHAVRESDAVSRLSGDEFGVLVRELRDPSDAERVAGKLVEALGIPFDVAGHQLHLSASVGVALATADGTTADQLLRAADGAMYLAKATGGTYRCADALDGARDDAHAGR